jgi:hypothetical protein
MKRFVIAATLFVLLPVSAYAQYQGPPTARTDIEKKRDAETSKAYQDTLKRMGDSGQPANADPWQSVRPAPATTDSTKK